MKQWIKQLQTLGRRSGAIAPIHVVHEDHDDTANL